MVVLGFSNFTGRPSSTVPITHFNGVIAPTDDTGEFDGTVITDSPFQTLVNPAKPVFTYFTVDINDGAIVLSHNELTGSTLSKLSSTDSSNVDLSFKVSGKEKSIFATTNYFIKHAVKIEFYISNDINNVFLPANKVLFFNGVIDNTKQVGNGSSVSLEVFCSGHFSKFGSLISCLELQPLAGKKRVEIVQLIFDSLGITQTIVAPSLGQEYFSEVQISGDNQSIFQEINEFVKPEGWFLRRNFLEDTYDLVPFKVREAPLAPHRVWYSEDLINRDYSAPSNSASKIRISGITTTTLQLGSLVIELKELIIEAIYSRATAVEFMDSSGVRTPSGIGIESPRKQIIQRQLLETHTVDGELIYERERVWAHYNPQTFLQYNISGTLFFNPLGTYISADGNGIIYSTERFMLVQDKEKTYNTLANGDVSEVEITKAWTKRVAAASRDNLAEGVYLTSTFYVFADGESYIDDYEFFDKKDKKDLIKSFNSAGEVARTVLDEYKYYSAKKFLNGSTANLVSLNGRGMHTDEEIFLLVKTTIEINTTSNGVLTSRLRSSTGYNSLVGLNTQTERFGLIKNETEHFRMISRSMARQVINDSEDGQETNFLNALPVPEYDASIWNRIRKEEFEIIFDNPLAEAWFGPSIRTISSPYIQNTDEALKVYKYESFLEFSYKAEIMKVYDGVREGDTVEIWSPEDSLLGRRFIVLSVEPSFDFSTNQFMMQVSLASPVIEGA